MNQLFRVVGYAVLVGLLLMVSVKVASNYFPVLNERIVVPNIVEVFKNGV